MSIPVKFVLVDTNHAGVYTLVASGPSGSAEKCVKLIVSVPGGEEEVGEVDLTPIPVTQLGTYVTEHHANGNKKFFSNYTVSYSLYSPYIQCKDLSLCIGFKWERRKSFNNSC